MVKTWNKLQKTSSKKFLVFKLSLVDYTSMKNIRTLHPVPVSFSGFVIFKSFNYSSTHIVQIILIINNTNNCFNKYLDGVIDNDKLIEIKTPYAARNTISGVQAVDTGKVCILTYKYIIVSFCILLII